MNLLWELREMGEPMIGLKAGKRGYNKEFQPLCTDGANINI